MSKLKEILLLLFLCPVGITFAQIVPTDSTDRPGDENVLDQIIEDAIIDVETDDQTDWTFLTDELLDLQQRPLNINTASKGGVDDIAGNVRDSCQ